MDEDDPLSHIALPPHEALPAGFALRLQDRRGVSNRANYPADQMYAEPPCDEHVPVLRVSLPLKITFEALHRGILIFDFSANADFCGGDTPPLYSGGPDAAYHQAQEVRLSLARKRAQYINAFLATLWVGGQQASAGIGAQPPIHLGNYMSAAKVNGLWQITGPGASPPIGGWPTVSYFMPGDAFRNAGAVFATLHHAFGESTFELLPLLQDCIDHYRNQQFAAALVIGWSAAEAMIARRWRAYFSAADAIHGGHTKFNKERRDRLKGRDFTASVMIEALSLAGRLSERDRETLDIVRKARNDFVHKLSAPDPNRALLGASVAAQLMGEDAGCDFRIGSGYSFQI